MIRRMMVLSVPYISMVVVFAFFVASVSLEQLLCIYMLCVYASSCPHSQVVGLRPSSHSVSSASSLWQLQARKPNKLCLKSPDQ